MSIESLSLWSCVGIVGAGGHARVVVGALKAINAHCDVWLFDRDWPNVQPQTGGPVKGAWPPDSGFAPEQGPMVVAVGANVTRGQLFERLSRLNYQMPPVVHPSAIVAQDVAIGAGTFVSAGAIMNPAAKTGTGVIINTGVIIEHDCSIADFVHISPGAVIAGGASVGEFSWIGANATLSHGVSVAANVVIGAGAVVIRDITQAGTYAGVPARRIA